MKIEQIYTGCLAQGAYYIESQGEAAIVDPLREVEPYIKRAEDDGARIKYIFETHFHADFVSGHLTLSRKTGADIIYGPLANPSFEAVIAENNQEFKIGALTLKVLHTPGHTMESTTFLLLNPEGKEHAIFSGDTLFLGDVGRPDLAQKAAHLTQDELAGLLYDSLREKIMPLPDSVIVYPAHGAGSACGKNMMQETVDTLGNQKKVNYALRADMTRNEFIEEVTHGLMPPPKYFPLNVKLNREGYEDIGDVLKRGNTAFTPEEFERAANETGALLLDVRQQEEFASGHIPRSVFIGLQGDFAPWVGALIADVKQPILLIAPEDKVEETVTRLSRVGFDHTLGYLRGGFEAWKEAGKEYDTVTSVAAEDVKKEIKQHRLPVFDVRKSTEYESEHIVDARNTPLDTINNHLAGFPRNHPFYLHCAGGYRSMIAASILKSRGLHNLVDIAGGFEAMKKAGIEVTDYACPSGN
jgi:glyoxylase-like metal-dependent hydrolase (beta-lactamase superfamily II)/rhodanese-related sulfurtransferase